MKLGTLWCLYYRGPNCTLLQHNMSPSISSLSSCYSFHFAWQASVVVNLFQFVKCFKLFLDSQTFNTLFLEYSFPSLHLAKSYSAFLYQLLCTAIWWSLKWDELKKKNTPGWLSILKSEKNSYFRYYQVALPRLRDPKTSLEVRIESLGNSAKFCTL